MRAAAAAALAVVVGGCAASAAAVRSTPTGTTTGAVTTPTTTTTGAGATPAPARPGPPYAVGERVITFVDTSRTVQFPGRPPEPRTLVTVVRYPITGPSTRVDVRDAPPDRADGPFPLVVFGHGYAVTPATYYRLLRAWAAAGFVVAAPVFPLENAHAPGGPDESDLTNQPGDMSDVISGMLAANANSHALLAGTINPHAIAVSGQSDGGETALAVAYDRYYLDLRVRAAVVLSGARIPGPTALWFPPGAPPLLATQGTADVVNLPKYTYAFFRLAHNPKYLLSLPGAAHLAPYTGQQPQLTIVERVSIAFLNRYLRGTTTAARDMASAGNTPGIAQLTGDP